MTSFGLKEYYKPTPLNMRRLGDGLLAFSLTMSGASVISENKTLAIIMIVVAGVGKFITNFFSQK